MSKLAPLVSSRVLSRILDEPNLAPAVRALSGHALGRLVDYVGLEDAGEIVALASTEQLALVFDEDLFQSDAPGEDPRFDAGRFRLWLEVLLEAGGPFVAERLAELPLDLLTLAFHELVLVFDADALALELEEMGEDGELTHKALSEAPSEEFDRHLVLARKEDGWDAVLEVLVALDRDHHDLLTGVLETCAEMDADRVEDAGGLYEVLSAEESLAEDVADAREARRAAEGHVAPSAAKSFLALAAKLDPDATNERDPVTRAYFRDYVRRAPSTPKPARPPSATSAAAPLLAILSEAELLSESTAALLPREARDHGEGLYLDALRRLGERDAERFDERAAELVYLANALAAGVGFEGRRLRAVEALEAAAAGCAMGLEAALAERRGKTPDELAEAIPADALFRRAWATLARRSEPPPGLSEAGARLFALAHAAD